MANGFWPFKMDYISVPSLVGQVPSNGAEIPIYMCTCHLNLVATAPGVQDLGQFMPNTTNYDKYRKQYGLSKSNLRDFFRLC